MNSITSCQLFRWSFITFRKITKFRYIPTKKSNFKLFTCQRFYCSISKEEISPNNVNNDEFEFDDEQPYYNVNFETIAQGDEEKIKKLKLIQLEIDMMSQQGEKVPTKITTEQWNELLLFSDFRTQKIRFLKYLWLREVKKDHFKQKRAELNTQFLKKKAQKKLEEPTVFTTSSPMMYGLKFMTLFHRIYDTQINKLYNYKLLQALWFGPHILVDCEYEEFMTLRDKSHCVKQILLMWSENRDNFNPFDIIFCNMNPDGFILRKLKGLFPTLNDPDFPFNMTSKNYLDLYPRDKLVYLTPHCKEILTEYNSNDIYIIGALVDKSKCEPLSLAKAKRDKLRMAKFPIDKYLHWGQGHKSLALNQCISIMNDVKNGYNWTHAFKHVPERKIVNVKYTNEYEAEKKENHLSAKGIREQHRRNLVYDLLMKEQFRRKKDMSE